ncbi:ABC1 family protein C21C3.03, mitochondrial [Psilocybe cubensis]|uniref:ABC1 atypical kinase-like domain-containing protein n=2 Tax=Psilocybe cubensis TaxID=181762 RepID=A0A8H8CQG1_PSICU|nr:ABC1 family protein C21C3.03, mitochondrial [Psilocybe cubensis]KAH9486519.1 ABC1 family protein C21C3.03, mitochondrial [Psilocybe cubensis]
MGFVRLRYVLAVPVVGLAACHVSPARPTIIPVSRRPRIVYSPNEERLSLRALLQTHLIEPLLTARRFVYLLLLFAPVLLASPMLLVGRPDPRLAGDRWGAVWWYGLLVSRMEAAGPTFIKLSQWAASRADLFPALLCRSLAALHSQATPHPLAHTKAVIRAVFQRPFDDVFESFDDTPIGTGAIAQVYRATLKQDLIPPSYLGPRRNPSSALAPVILKHPLPSIPTASVAIKILHPHVANTISRDLKIMHFFARCINLIPGMQWISLPEEVQVFGSMMNQQLDLRHEADNLLTFESNFAARKVPVTFPRPLKNFSTQHLLVEEYMNALPLETFLRNGGGPFDDQLATFGLDAFLNMLLLDNFVHSDLHPGNIMIKFSKPPTTRILLENLYHKYITPLTSPASANEPMVAADYSDSDSIVSRLRTLKNDPEKWRSALDDLHEAGYLPEIVFIDAGLVTTLSDTNRTNFIDLFRAVAEFDGYRTGQLMVERSRFPELAIDTETFALKMQHLVLNVKRKTFSLGQIKISDLLSQVLRNVQVHHVKMEGDFVNTVISILLLEGIGRQLDPGLDLFASALPILRKLGGQVAAREGVTKDLPRSDFGALLKASSKGDNQV